MMNLFLEIVHNLIAHPLLALVMPLRFVIWFVECLHDATAPSGHEESDQPFGYGDGN